MLRAHVGIKAIQYVNLPLEEDYCVIVSKDIGCYYHWLIFITISQHIFKFLLKVIFIGVETTVEKLMSFELLFLSFSPEGFFVLQCFDDFGVVIGRLSEEEDLLVGKVVDLILKIVSNFIVGDILTDIFFPFGVADDLKLFDLLPSPVDDAFHSILDKGCECFFIDIFVVIRVKSVLSNISRAGAGDKTTNAKSGLMFFSKSLHIL